MSAFYGLVHEHLHVAERGGFWEGLQPSLSPIVQIYDALKSSFVAVFADREATADGLNPLTISARKPKPKRVQNQTKIRLTRTAFCIDSQ